MSQPLFHAAKKILLVAGFCKEDAVRIEPGPLKGWREQILTRYAPEHASACPGCDPGSKMCSGRAIDRPISAASYFVKAAKSETAARQSAVDRRNTEGQSCARAAAGAFEMRDTRPKLVDCCVCGTVRHSDL